MEEKALAIVDNKVIEDFIFSTGTILTPQHKKLFISLAIHNQLDPFKREIHAIPYKDKEGKVTLSVVTGYEVYLKRAERSGKLDGWRVWTEGQGDALKAIVEIRRKDWKDPLKHEVIFKEYNLGRSLWISKPITMIKKVAIAQGFRLAFPEELGGIPFTADEIDTEITKIETPIKEAEVVEAEPASPEDMEEFAKKSEKKCSIAHDEMMTITNIPHLRNFWKKYEDEFKKLLPEHYAILEQLKESLRVTLRKPKEG